MMTPVAMSVLLSCAFASQGVTAVERGPIIWIEAEGYRAQSGSSAPSCSMPSASGGACVDNDWGGRKGDYLAYAFELTVAIPTLHVMLRYARETGGESSVQLTLDGNEKQSAIARLPSTGNWGFTPQGWRYVAVQLPHCGQGTHTLEIRSLADRNNVNFDGFYLSPEPLDVGTGMTEMPTGPDLIAAMAADLCRLPCRTPLALPYSRRKAVVAGDGLLQSLLSTPSPAGMGGNVEGPSLHVLLVDHGPWHSVEQTVLPAPVPTVLTRFHWPDVEVVQQVLAASPEEQGFFMHVNVTNKQPAAAELELVSLVRHASGVDVIDCQQLVSAQQPLLSVLPRSGATTSAELSIMPGPLGGPCLRHRLQLDGASSQEIHLQFLGAGATYHEASTAAERLWQERLAPARQIRLPDQKLQFAFETSLRHILALIESRPDHARILKGLQHYYGANPYDTFQVSRALDAVGLKNDAEELLRHQVCHLKDDGIFEMWETGDLQRRGAEQWIVQGLAATALWQHYEVWHDEAWLREIAPTLIKAAQATLRARQGHSGSHQQGTAAVEGWLPPLGGDGGLGVGYHWSQNAGPLNGVRIAAEAARRLGLPETDALHAGWLDYQRAFHAVCSQAASADPDHMLASFPGAEGAERTRPLWGVVMSVTAFEAIRHDDPAALKTLRSLQNHRYHGLHLNLGYSRGVWPYLSAEVAQWHLRLGETDEAWRILRAIVDRASTTACWYEEIDHDPPHGHGDSADVWAAAEIVYLSSKLVDATPDAATDGRE